MERWWGNKRKRAREGGDEGRVDLARGENKKNKKSKKNKKPPNSRPPPPQITNNLVDDDDDVEELEDMDKLEHGSCCFDDDDLSNTTCSSTAYERMFEFPWLKEGMNSFKSEDYCQQLQLEDSFSSFNSNLFEASTSSNHSAAPELFPGPQPNLCDSLLPHHHKLIEEQVEEEEEEDEEENDLLTFKADELEGTDWIWSSPLLDDHQSPPQLAANGFNKSVAAIVFGDGSDAQLYPLTKRRSEGAIPIAAKYRLIDAVVSNCINSNINKIYALTQFNSTSLNSHLTRAYSGVGLGKEGFVEVIAAYQSLEDKRWFQGTADAIRRCLWMLEEYPIVEFLVLPGYHLYRMDYRKLIESHRNSKADVTCAVLTSMRNHQESKFGIFKVDFENKVMEFREKPENNLVESISAESTGKSSNSAHNNFPGMGIYVINRDAMIKLLREYFPKANDLRGEIIPGAISIGMKVHAYCFDGYWEDMRSIEAYYQANMESTKKASMGYNFDDEDSPLYTMARCLPPSLLTDAVITDSVIGDGCILNRCNIKGTVVGLRTKVGDGAVIEDSILMGSDIYQTQDVRMDDKGMGIPIGIGEGSHIRKAIVDKNARIGKKVMIINKDNVQEANMEANGYIIKEGIVVVVRSAAIPDGSIL